MMILAHKSKDTDVKNSDVWTMWEKGGWDGLREFSTKHVYYLYVKQMAKVQCTSRASGCVLWDNPGWVEEVEGGL